MAHGNDDYRIGWQPGKILLGEYVVERMLGQGGMGSVYLARSRYYKDKLFAVKTLLASSLNDEKRRKEFLRELRTWIDLPRNPNLTACLFFRTVEDRLAIFAEYIPGGSLRKWIADGRFTDLESILDVAIQFAWGLHTAHIHGVVHQDVKPGNALMTEDGILKVTDFGLAHPRNLGGIGNLETAIPSDTVLVSSMGMTPAYCSPEQAENRKVGRRTDMWSWGLSILEMFTGEVTWRLGLFAPRVLEQFLSSPPLSRPAMPVQLADILRRCFRENPDDRWTDMAEIVNLLIPLYDRIAGKPYPRQLAEIQPVRTSSGSSHARRTVTGTQWDDPREWFERICKASGRNIPDSGEIHPDGEGSREVQSIRDLEQYEEISVRYRELLGADQSDLNNDFSRLLAQKALIQKDTGDYPGAIKTYDESIAHWQVILEKEPSETAENHLAGTLADKALLLGSLGRETDALEYFNRALDIRERLVFECGRSEFSMGLVKCYTNKSNTLGNLGRYRESIYVCDRAISILETISLENPSCEISMWLSDSYLNKAVSLMDLGLNSAALEQYDKSIEMTVRLIESGGFEVHGRDLALAYMNKALLLNRMQDYRSALDFYSNTVDIYRKLLSGHHRDDLMFELARTLINHAGNYWYLNDSRNADSVNTEAMKILEELVFWKGRNELTSKLALCYMNKALFSDDRDEDIPLYYQKAIDILERLVLREGRAELTKDLALIYSNLSNVHTRQGNLQAALVMSQRAVTAAFGWVIDGNHPEDGFFLGMAFRAKGMVLRLMGRYAESLELVERAVSVIRELVTVCCRDDLKTELLTFEVDRARTAFLFKPDADSRTVYADALANLRAIYEQTGQSHLKSVLEEAETDLKG
ncbi:serine/threonine protein kinase [bacterium]|nr:serine/threonine protein kinase [candidate division CSSED10-310 bacterium]